MDRVGELLSSLAIARALRERGHAVAFVCGPGLAPLVRREGFERFPRGEQDGASFETAVCAVPMEMVRQVRHIEFALGRFPADMLVGQQFAFGASLAAERQRLPLGVVGQLAYLFPRVPPPPPEARDAATAHAVRLYEGLLPHRAAAREACGLPPEALAPQDTPLIGDVLLLRTVPELEPDAASLPARVHLVGDCLGLLPEAPDGALREWFDGAEASGRPVIYARLGGMPPTCWSALVEALRDEPLQVLVTGPEALARAAPAHFLVRPQVPEAFVLERACAVLTLPGSSAVLGAFTRGRPCVLLLPEGPQLAGEYPAVAERCIRAGAAVGLGFPPSGPEPTRLREAVRIALESPALHAHAQHLQQAFAGFHGLARAAVLLERPGNQALGPLPSP
jgi:UDP:flavonoid glycosyltransferase YjiC (YdhE family)